MVTININAVPLDTQHHVVVFGGGFAGIRCIKSLKSANVPIVRRDILSAFEVAKRPMMPPYSAPI